MTTEHVLTPDDRCPCGQPQEGSGYCSYECYSKHEPDPTPASMGGPLSEAERLAEIKARVAAAKPRPETNWRKPLLASGEMRRHAEADVVFLLAELDRASARVGVLEGQLATAQEQLASVRNLQEIEIGRHWNSHSEAEAQGRNATLREVQQILDGGDPPRSDLTQTEVRNRFQRHIAALGLDGGGSDGS